jgi:D-3-phosphoglycerate dehydrogenase / 2-oxoglutarate reductase
MSWKILINDGLEDIGIDILKQKGFDVSTTKVVQDNLISELPAFDGIIVRSATKVRKEHIDQCPNLKFIARGGVGMDNIDVGYARSKGIQVINTPAASSRSVAELAMAHLLGLTRRLQDSNRRLVDSHSFSNLKKEYSSGTEIIHKTLLLIGFGRIGKEFAKMALGAEMKVVVCDPYLTESSVEFRFNNSNHKIDLPLVPLHEGLAQADYISLHSPFGGEAILTQREFSKMKKGVFIINTSRGENINEKDLLEAIENGTVAGAGLDVFQMEPNIDSRFLQHQKISVTPHIGASTNEAQQRIAIELADLIGQYYHSLINV